MLLIGRFDQSGSAVIDINVAGPTGRKSYVATLDTGFSGFVALPFNESIDLGLVIDSAANVQLGDGSIITNYVSTGSVTLGTSTESGAIVLDENSGEILVGMAFLREFKMALILTNSVVVLYDEHEALDAVVGFMSTAPPGQPNTSPTAIG